MAHTPLFWCFLNAVVTFKNPLGGILLLRRQTRGRGVRKMHILLNKMSTKGGRGGQKSLKSCLRSKSMTPKQILCRHTYLKLTLFIEFYAILTSKLSLKNHLTSFTELIWAIKDRLTKESGFKSSPASLKFAETDISHEIYYLGSLIFLKR